MKDQKSQFMCSNRVYELLQRAQQRYYKRYKNFEVTSEFLLYILMEDVTTLISKYMYDQRLFSSYIVEEYLSRCPKEEDEEDFCYMLLLTMIEWGIEILEIRYYIEKNKKSLTTSLEDILTQAKEIAERIGKEIVDEEVLTIALVQCNNPIWKVLDEHDVEDIASGMLLSHFSEENLTENGFLEEPEYCEGLYN